MGDERAPVGREGGKIARRKGHILLAATLSCMGLAFAAIAWGAQSVTMHAALTPDRLGVPTNLSATGEFASTDGGIPSPVTKVAFYTPAGATLNLSGTGTCTAITLEQLGPSECPANSRAGFGGGVGVFQLARETIREPFTVDLFLAPRQAGHLVMLAYVRAIEPASIELVLTAKEIRAPKPYGLGFSVEVPLIPTIPGASDASVESAFVTLGAANVAYYRTVHHKRTLQHLKGLISPKTCPRGGFSFQSVFDFADGTTTTGTSAIPCPRS